MADFVISAGIVPSAQKIVIYGPEGIGKSTFLSCFPDVVFIDTEGSTKRLNVRRLPTPNHFHKSTSSQNQTRPKLSPCTACRYCLTINPR